MNRDHSYYPYNNNEQPLEVEWQAPEQNDIAAVSYTHLTLPTILLV